MTIYWKNWATACIVAAGFSNSSVAGTAAGIGLSGLAGRAVGTLAGMRRS
jgi:hypothetical protein